MKIKDLKVREQVRNLKVEVKDMEEEVRILTNGSKVINMTIKDDKDTARLVFWNEQTSIPISVGDKLEIALGWCGVDQEDNPQVSLGRYGKLSVNGTRYTVENDKVTKVS